MSQSELLKKVVSVLDASGTPHMLTGSYASSLQGEPRLTHDIDLVVALTHDGAGALIQAFTPPDYYLEPSAIEQAIAKRSQFNLLDAAAGDKVDFWILSTEPFDQSRFSRRYVEEFEGTRLYVSRPEDTILMKLKWAALSGGSEKQFGDAKSVYELQFPNLDIEYIRKWAAELGVTDEWQRLQREARSMGEP